jgi:transcriptional regulator with XRE-family HTH domain
MNCIRQIRKAKGWKLTDLAAKIHTTEATASRYEREDQRLTLPILRRIAAALECTVADIACESAASPDERELLKIYRAMPDATKVLAQGIMQVVLQRGPMAAVPFTESADARSSG